MIAPRRVYALLAPVLLGACAQAPTQPTLLSLPGTGKSLEQFHADDADCRLDAAKRVAGPAGADWTQAQRGYDYAYIQCMYVKGHKVPVPGQFTSAPAAGQPPPQGKAESAPK